MPRKPAIEELRKLDAGGVLRQLRRKQKLHQDEVLERAGIEGKNSKLSKIERGVTPITVEVLDKLARALGSTAAEVLSIAQDQRETAPPTGQEIVEILDGLSPSKRAAIRRLIEEASSDDSDDDAEQEPPPGHISRPKPC